MDTDNFQGQLTRHFENDRKFLYKANNVSIALRVLMNRNLIDRNTLVVFDLDGTLFNSNADDLNREDVLLEEINDDFVQLYRRLQTFTNHTGIITGRHESKRRITERSLRNIDLNFQSNMIHFTNDKARNLGQMLGRLVQITRVIYFDDFLLNNGAIGTIQPLMIQYNNIKFIGVKVGDAVEFVLDPIDDSIFADLGIQIIDETQGRIISRIPQPVMAAVPAAVPALLARPVPAAVPALLARPVPARASLLSEDSTKLRHRI